jgi:Leucine-rich repeat (LRR) protein
MLQGLQRLRCSHNVLTVAGVPWDSLQALSQLTQLRLDHNQLASLGSWDMSSSRGLRLLDLSHNHLEALPLSIGQMRSLKELNVSHNALPSLPTEIGMLGICSTTSSILLVVCAVCRRCVYALISSASMTPGAASAECISSKPSGIDIGDAGCCLS